MEITQIQGTSSKIIDEVSSAIVGKTDLLHKIMATILAGGHVLLEDYPGLAKTLIANSFARALGLDFKRIQFTPDLLPGDITGGYIFDRQKSTFKLREGPVFSNIILADEINRASPKTQSALLEAMQENQVTLDGETMSLPTPFIVIATQNPIEYEGTFPLPEAQLDRFLVKLSVGYPSVEEEQEILFRRRERRQDEFSLQSVVNPQQLLDMRAALESVHVDPDIEKYIANIVAQTRTDPRTAVGASPRGSLALMKLARAEAALNGRSFVIPDDVKAYLIPALSHRLILKPDLWMSKSAGIDVLNQIANSVPVPVIN